MAPKDLLGGFAHWYRGGDMNYIVLVYIMLRYLLVILTKILGQGVG